MDATYLLRRFVDLCRTLTTRRWSLGTGCDEELGVYGHLQGVDGRSSSSHELLHLLQPVGAATGDARARAGTRARACTPLHRRR